MVAPERRALVRGAKWLHGLSIPNKDIERQILRIFALAITRSDSSVLLNYGKSLISFALTKYSGDPLPAICAHRALLAVGWVHKSLAALTSAYLSVLKSHQLPVPLLFDLMSIRALTTRRLTVPGISSLVIISREEVLELCRLVTMASSCGVRRIKVGRSAAILPRLAASYACDWDIETSSALLRVCQYLGLSGATACKWTTEWLLDQQEPDGRFGLHRVESEQCGDDPEDWRTYFDSTIHALWALSDITETSGLRIDLLRSPYPAKRRG